MNLSNKDIDSKFNIEVIQKWKTLDRDFRKKYATYASKYKSGNSVGLQIKMEMLKALGFNEYWLNKDELKELLKANSKK